jgi:hypothetical protein
MKKSSVPVGPTALSPRAAGGLSAGAELLGVVGGDVAVLPDVEVVLLGSAHGVLVVSAPPRGTHITS